MKINHVFLQPVHQYAYRKLDPYDIPLITGLVHVESENCAGRLCYEVTYYDGFKGYIPKSDVDDGCFRFVVQ